MERWEFVVWAKSGLHTEELLDRPEAEGGGDHGSGGGSCGTRRRWWTVANFHHKELRKHHRITVWMSSKKYIVQPN